jgi:hypothetical protein
MQSREVAITNSVPPALKEKPMDVELNLNRVGPVSPPQAPPRTREAGEVADKTEFSGSEALTQALDQVPDARPGQVERARQLVGSVKYPPDETLSRIATLLAMHLTQGNE